MKTRPDRREERRKEADARNEAWRSLSPAQKLESLNNRPGKSTRQRQKLGLADGGK